MLILEIAIGCRLRGQDLLVVTGVGCIAVMLQFDGMAHIHDSHIASEVHNMTVGLAGARVALMWGVKSTRIVVVLLDGKGGLF